MANTLYSCIGVSGDDAFDFLQGQLTNDLRPIDHRDDHRHEHGHEHGEHRRKPQLSAWCNPKGRVICLFRVRKIDGDYELALPTELAEAVLKRLTMFRFRAKVEFDIRPADMPAIGAQGSVEEWRSQNLRAGIPDVLQAQSEQFTPHMLNLDLLDAVNLDKGCYTGQEIVARTHYRGASKRRMLRFESSEPVSPGDKVYDGERKVGDVVNAIGTDLLAVVPIDRSDSALTADGIELTLKSLPYL